MSDFDYLIAGLGNPGEEYEWTAHNLGFLTVDRLAARNGIRVGRKDCMALVGQGRIGSKRVLLVKPQTFMNVSGPSVKGLMVKNDLQPSQVIVVYDDLDLPWRSLRIRPDGSAGGHHGVESVIRSVGSGAFTRVRLGVHGGQRNRDGAKIVLAELKRAQREELDELLDYASQAVESIIADGVEMSMTRFNRRAGGSTEEE